MSIHQDFKEVSKLTETNEKEFIKTLNKAYKDAYREVKKIVNNFIADYGVDGKLNQAQAMQYNRYRSLLKNIISELSRIENLQTYQIKTLLKDAYELNYYGTAYALEKNVQVKMGFSLINRTQVARMVTNPLMEIALDENKQFIRDRIRRVLTQSIVQGEGIQQTAAKLRDGLEISGNRATKIARTETTKVMSQARQDGMDKVEKRGIKLEKEWVATLDGRTRDSHANMDGERVPKDQPFSNGLMYPGDSSGGAEEVINCRCTMVAIVPDLDRIRSEMSVDERLGEYSDYGKWKRERLEQDN